jgi:hypothetical protein
MPKSVPRLSRDAALTEAAVAAATEGNQSEFARVFGYSQPSNVGRRLRGDVSLTETERRLYRAIVAHPEQLVAWFVRATD